MNPIVSALQIEGMDEGEKSLKSQKMMMTV
jgi:hypothetical protein